MNKPLYLVAIALSAFSFYITNAQEQELPVLIPNSPEATEFVKYGNTSVSMYTGTPNVSIPIYTIQGKEFSLPISLNYDAGGIKVNQIATQVGLAWSLQAGGMISRITNGKPDHVLEAASRYYDSYYSDYGNVSTFYQSQPEKLVDYQPSNLPYLPTLIDYFLYEDDILAGEIDTQPDYFSFNVGSISGTIFIDPASGEARCNNGKNYKITYGGNLSLFASGGVTNWTITDELGNQYLFGQNNKYDTTRTLIDSGGEDDRKKYISSWHLTKIISANGIDVLDFNYTFSNFWVNEKHVPSAVSTVKNLIDDDPLLNSCAASEGSPNSNTTPYGISQYYLYSIDLNGEQLVSFHQSTTERKDLSNRYALEKISLANGIDWELDQSYFKSSTNIDLNNITVNTQDDIRLKLDSVIKKTSGSAIGQQTYSFDYFNPNNVPNLQSFSQDFWGFYNGKSNTSTLGLVPKMDVFYEGNMMSFSGADREPDLNSGKNGTLSKITHPTGGHTEFEYESHSVHKTETDTEIVFNNIVMGSLVGGNDLSDPYDYWDDEYFYDNPKGAEFIVPVYESGVKDIAIQYFSPNQPHGPGDNDDGILFVAILKCSGAAPTPPDDCGGPGGPGGPGPLPGCPLNLDWDDIINYPINDRILIRSYKGGGDPGALPNGYTEIIPIDLTPGYYKAYILNGVTNSSLSVSMRYYTEETESQTTARTIGGLRIKKTKDFVANSGSPVLTKAYTYTKTAYDDCDVPFQASTGKLHYDPIFSFNSTYKHTSPNNANTFLVVNNCTYLNRTSHSINANQSPHIAYSNVTEKHLDNNNANNGANEYHFYNDLEPSTNIQIFPPYLKSNFKNGNIKQQLSFNKSNVLKQKTENIYSQTQMENPIKGYLTDLKNDTEDAELRIHSNFGGTQYFLKKLPIVCGQVGAVLVCYGSSFPFPLKTYSPPYYNDKLNATYEINSYYAHLDETITTKYFGTDSTTTKTNYYYDGLTLSPKTHRQVSRTKTVTTDGKIILTNTYYPDDVLNITSLGLDPLSIPERDAIHQLRDLNRKAVPIQSNTYEDLNSDGDGDANELLSSQRTNYKDLGLNRILPEFVQTLKGEYDNISNKLEDRIVYHQYDGNGNPLEISKKDGTKVCYIWGYDKRYPIAKIENATYFTEVSFLQGSLNLVNLSNADDSVADENALRTALDGLRSGLPNALVSTYTYDPLIGITSVTDPSGYTTFYEYDDFNRLISVKDADGKLLSENQYHYKQ